MHSKSLIIYGKKTSCTSAMLPKHTGNKALQTLQLIYKIYRLVYQIHKTQKMKG